MTRVKSNPALKLQGRGIELGVFAVLLALPLLESGNQYRLYLSSLMVLYAGAALVLTVLLGITRQFFLATAASMAIGAYAAGIMSTRWGVSLPVVLLAAIVVAGLLGLLIGTVTLRLGGLYYALATLGVVLGVTSLASNWDSFTNGLVGIADVPPPHAFGVKLGPLGVYELGAVLLLIEGAMLFNLKRSTYWSALKLVGDREYLASTIGIRVNATRVTVTVIVSMAAAVWGVFYTESISYVEPTTFGLPLTVSLLMMVAVGGLGSLWGAILGAMLVVQLPQWLGSVQSNQDIYNAAILLAIVLLLPKGVVPSLQLRAETWWRGRAGAGDQGGGTAAIDSESDRSPAASRSMRTSMSFEGTELRAEGVAMAFGGVKALRDATLVAQPGKIEGLIGTNGSGKTTLLNCISGLLQPDSGSIRLGDLDITGLPPHTVARHGLARTYQTPQLVLEMNALDNAVLGWHQSRDTSAVQVALGLGSARRDDARAVAQARALCRELDLHDALTRRASDLSTGDRRVIEIARALGSRPRALFLDEPATGLTGLERERLMTVLDGLRSNGLTIVVIDHDMEFLFGIADHVTALDRGANIASGTPDEIRASQAVIDAYFGEPTAHV